MLSANEVGIDQILPSFDDLASHNMDELKEDSMLQNKVHATRRGETKLWLVGLKG